MKKIILIILTLLLIPFFIITIKDIDREEVNPALTYNLTTADSTYTDLNNHTLQEVFESTTPALENLVTNGDFVNSSNWLTYRGLFSVSNNIGSFIGNVSSVGAFIYQDLSVNINDVIYVKAELRTIDTDVSTIRLLWQSITALIDISNPIQNQWYSGSASIISTSSTPRYELGIRATETNGKTLQTKNALAFNLTASHGVTATSGIAYDNAVAEIEWILSKNDGYIQSVGNPFEIVDLTVEEMDDWYTIYQTYHTTYTTLTLGTATPTTYTSLQQLILDNDGKDFKLYRNDVVDETHYRLTQETDYISITNDNDLEIIRINDDDTFESSLQIDDTIDYKLVGYNVTSYVDGSFDNTILAFVWIIPILLIGGFFFIIFSHRKED